MGGELEAAVYVGAHRGAVMTKQVFAFTGSGSAALSFKFLNHPLNMQCLLQIVETLTCLRISFSGILGALVCGIFSDAIMMDGLGRLHACCAQADYDRDGADK